MATRKLPSTFRQIVVNELGHDFRKITEIVAKPLPQLKDKEILVKNRFVGINASDINFTAGSYFPGVKPPFSTGFEGMGEVAAVGPNSTLQPGQNVAYNMYGAFGEYHAVPEQRAFPVPECDPRFLSMIVSGFTASISLEKNGELKKGESVLVTAAAGGTGQYAVQLAKLAGCHVIGTCSSEDKVNFLKSIGCDRTINYKTEDMADVLAKEYPKGIDVVYESVGTLQFKAALMNLAKFGRMILIGQISSYGKDEENKLLSADVNIQLIKQSASMAGFFMPDYAKDMGRHGSILTQLIMEGKVKIAIDKGENADTGPFVGLEKVADAVEYMYSKGNIGKIVVELNSEDSKS